MYRLNKDNRKIDRLDEFQFLSEGAHKTSPQKILADNPEIIFELSELELLASDVFLSLREYNTSRGFIDLLMIGSNAEIILVETKLLRNPESTRQVVAQIIDYVKAFSEESLDDLIRKIQKDYRGEADKLKNDINFASLVSENIRTGNFKVLIVGDRIHPHVLGMVESIHSAPHLAFTIYLINLNSYQLSEEEILIDPSIVSSTVEIERSVIKIEIEPENIDYRIQSETPQKEGKGRKPILSWNEYIENLTEPEFRPLIKTFRDCWLSEIDDSINMGQVGFSAGLEFGDKRIPIQFVYDNRIPIISERHRKAYDIPKRLYDDYLKELSNSPYLYDKFIASGKVEVSFDDIDKETLSMMLNAAIGLARDYKEMN